jgi:cellulose synthase/poly-beta-1,6-N-acetylglucosamine synthase-like glycosyltransferase
LIVHIISHWTYKSIPISHDPARLTHRNTTVIIPTIHINFEELRESLESILACQPYELILVTTNDKFNSLYKFSKTLSSDAVTVYACSIANKRLQVCEALGKVQTEITILADDDVTWPSTILPWLLSPFDNPKIGAVGPSQRVKRLSDARIDHKIWNFLGAAYIERRNFEISATHHMDGGTSCMSGRTCAFRTKILQASDFLDGFRNERWRSYILNADDDNFVTRWLVSHDWKTWIQYDDECQIETTLENNPKFLRQCLRWTRSNWRSNYTSLITEACVWTYVHLFVNYRSNN